METINPNRKMKSIPLKNVHQHLFIDLQMALVDIKSVLDPFALLSATDFYSHLHKKLKESYSRVMIQMFPNQEIVHEKMMKLFTVQLSLINYIMDGIKTDRSKPTVDVTPYPHKPVTVHIKEELIEIIDTIGTSIPTSPVKDNSEKHGQLPRNVKIEGETDQSSADHTVAIDYENVKKHANFESNQENSQPKKTQFKCNVCAFTSFTRIALKKHQITHNRRKTFKCNDCSKSFNDKEQFSMHKKEHGEEMPYSCSRCKGGFFQKDEKDQHEESCKSIGHYNCEHCNFTCNSKSGLTSHEKSHSKYYCDHCDKNFTSSSNLQRHKRIVLRRSAT